MSPARASTKGEGRRSKRAAGVGDPVGPPPARRLWRVLLAVCCGVMIFTSFPYTTEPDTNLWPLTWIGFVPLLWALRGGVTRKQAFFTGWLAGFVTNFGGFWWIFIVVRDFGHLPDAVAWGISAVNAAYQGLLFGLFATLYVRLRGAPSARDPSPRLSIFAIAALFTVLEFFFPLLFPWFLGNSQYRFLPAIQIAELTGVMGVTFVIVLCNGAAFRLLERVAAARPLPVREVAIGFAIVVATLLYGIVRTGQVDAAIAEAEKLRIGMVEANIGIWDKQARGLDRADRAMTLHRNLLEHQHLSRKLVEEAQVDLIVWPESSYLPLDDPFIKRHDHFALGLSGDGQLAAWRHLPAGGASGAAAGFGWTMREAGVGEGRFFALDVPHEAAWVAVGERGRAVWSHDGHVTPLETGTDDDLFAVSAVAATDATVGPAPSELAVWVAGADGTLVGGTPPRLERVGLDVTADLRAITFWSTRDGVVVGDGGAVIEVRGGRADAVPMVLGEDLHAVWAQPGGAEVYAVGEGGTIVRRGRGDAGSRAEWSVELSGTSAALHAVAGDAGRAVYAGGDRGTLRARIDGGWRAVDFPGRVTIRAMTVDPRGTLLVADEAGAIWARPDGAGAFERLDTPGIAPLIDLAPAPYARSRHLPRDVAFIHQGRAPLPDVEAYTESPQRELSVVPMADRAAVQRGFTAPIIFGGITVEPAPADSPHGDRYDKYNTAIMLDRDGRVVGTYDKVYLLLFGEYMPLGDLFPGLYDLFRNAGRFRPGEGVEVFAWGDLRVGVMICYEDILPKFTGKLADKAPNVIINVTNDAWFGESSEPYLHLALAIFRSVENRLALVRSTNTGISAFVDATGRVVSQTSLSDAEVLVEDVAMMEGGTFYARVGDVFSYGLLLGLVGWALWRRRRRSGDGAKGG